MRLFQCIIKVFDGLSHYVLAIVFSICSIAALIIKAMYRFDDSPYFIITKWFDIVIFLIVLLIIYLILRSSRFIQEHLNIKITFIVFMGVAIAYILLVPLKPFSDMQHVYDAAIKVATFQWKEIWQDEYWTTFGGNIYLAFFWGAILIILPKSLITIKIINAVLVFGCAYYLSALAKLYNVKYDKVLFLEMLTFSPLFLYINHIYFDIPFLFFEIVTLYIYKKYNNLYFLIIPIAIAIYLRSNGFIILAAILLAHIFHDYTKIDKKKIFQIGLVCLLIFVIPKTAKYEIGKNAIPKDLPSYSSWNQIYIGINEKEFGFMDNDLSYDRDFNDIIERVQDYGAEKIAKIFCKKTFWLWTQGTYQAQRYAFGADTDNSKNKFEYKTILTERLLHDDQIGRVILNSEMRAQYLVFFFAMTITMIRKKNISSERELYYAMMGTFLIMLIWELKSRYIMMCIPMMMILAQQFFESWTMLNKNEELKRL